MAITKIHNIKVTLDKAIKYICNETKTDGEIFISSFSCGHETAALEFEKTRELHSSAVKILARHLVQSFDPNDCLTPTLAHQVGLELVEKVLKGGYEYVLTTHIDKGHIHNHIIFNNVSFQTGKAYNSYQKTYDDIRKTSDRLCEKYGLDVIDENKHSHEKGKSYKEYTETKKGTSWKAKLKYTIDSTIKKATDWNDFLMLMRLNGYEIKEGKHISFKALEQKRFTRAKTIGTSYTEEKIKSRIRKQNQRFNQNKYNYLKRDNLTSVIDVSSNTKAKTIKGYAVWAKKHNLKAASETLSLMNAQGISSLEELYKSIENTNIDALNTSRAVIDTEKQMKQTKAILDHLTNYNRHKALYLRYQNTHKPDEFFSRYASQILLFERAVKELKNLSIDVTDRIEKYEQMLIRQQSSKKHLMKDYYQKRDKITKLSTLKSNIEVYLNTQSSSLDEIMEHKV